MTVLHPGGKVPAKRWPADRFAGLARALAARGHRVVLTGSAGERALADRVAHDAGLPPTAVLAGRTGLAELAALVADARLVVSGDTGVAHLATGYGTASVVLFGPVPAAHWGPPADRPRHRVLGVTGAGGTEAGGVGRIRRAGWERTRRWPPSGSTRWWRRWSRWNGSPVRLRRSDPGRPGYGRRRRGKGWLFLDAEGRAGARRRRAGAPA